MRFRLTRRTCAIGLAACALVVLPQSDAAPAQEIIRSRADIDIDSLRGVLHDTGLEWELDVRFEVEVEDAAPDERFDAVLKIKELGRTLRDRRGRIITVIVPLEEPVEIDEKDNEIEFEERLTIPIDPGAICNPYCLRIYAIVVPRGQRRVLEKSDSLIRFDD